MCAPGRAAGQRCFVLVNLHLPVLCVSLPAAACQLLDWMLVLAQNSKRWITWRCRGAGGTYGMATQPLGYPYAGAGVVGRPFMPPLPTPPYGAGAYRNTAQGQAPASQLGQPLAQLLAPGQPPAPRLGQPQAHLPALGAAPPPRPHQPQAHAQATGAPAPRAAAALPPAAEGAWAANGAQRQAAAQAGAEHRAVGAPPPALAYAGGSSVAAAAGPPSALKRKLEAVEGWPAGAGAAKHAGHAGAIPQQVRAAPGPFPFAMDSGSRPCRSLSGGHPRIFLHLFL